MHCHDAQQNLNAAVDRELSWRDRLALRAHLLRCRACRGEMKAIRSLSHRLTTLPAPGEFATAPRAVLTAAREAASSPTRSPRRLRRLALAASGGALVMALALFLMMRPSPALAAYQSMISAVRKVKTFHMVDWVGSPGMPRKTYERWYDEGKWRLQDPNGMIQVFDGKQLDQYLPWSNTIFLGVSDQPFGTAFGGFTVADMLKQENDLQVELSRTRGSDGSELNRFAITHGTRERMVILADRQNDLPVSIETYENSGSAWRLAGSTEKIEYNVPLSPDLFVLRPPEGATVIDHAEWDVAWEQRYEKGLGRAMLGGHEVVLRDVQVTTKGKVFTIWSGTKSSVTNYAAPGQPERYDVDAELTDSLGTIYLRDFFGARGPSCTYFVPLVESSSRPAWYELTVIERSGQRGERVQSARFRVSQPAYSPLPDPIYPAIKGDARSGFTFARGPFGEAGDAELRAQYWENHGDLTKALPFWEQYIAIIDSLQDHPNWGQPYWWRHIGELYENLGMRTEAKQAYQRGLDCDDGQGPRGDVKVLREALRRLR